MTSQLLANARLALPSGDLRAGWLRVQEGRIAALGEGAADGPARDLGGAVLAPGLIDVHVHGAAGAEFLDADPAERAAILRAHARGGTTGLLATTVTASRERLRRRSARWPPRSRSRAARRYSASTSRARTCASAIAAPRIPSTCARRIPPSSTRCSRPGRCD